MMGGRVGWLILGLVRCHVGRLRCRSLPPSSLLSVNQGDDLLNLVEMQSGKLLEFELGEEFQLCGTSEIIQI